MIQGLFLRARFHVGIFYSSSMRISNSERQPSLGFVNGTSVKVDDLTCCLSHPTCRGSFYGPCLVDGQKQSAAAAPVPAKLWHGFVNVGWQAMFAVDRIAAGTGEGNAPHECLPHKNNLDEISGTAVRVIYLSRQQRRRPVVLNCREHVVENKDLVFFWVVRRHHHPRRSGQNRLAAANALERTGLSAERNTAAFFFVASIVRLVLVVVAALGRRG
jgi:hypothetical protein